MRLRDTPPALRALYIVIVPVVLLIILLNSGFLQRVLPAARVHGERYSVVRYNYYYYDCYNRFLEEYGDELDDLGYNPRVSANSQSAAEGISWKEYFQRLAEASLAETAYYNDLAVAADYMFSEAELAPVQERLEADRARQAESNINAKNFYISYYGSGMDEASYTSELTRQIKAQAYKTHLAETAQLPPAEISSYLSSLPASEGYRTVDLRVITLEALPDRETGEIGVPQLRALEAKLGRLVSRYEAGVPFETLQAAFSSISLGDGTGTVLGGTRAALPELVAQWCVTEQDGRAAGDTAALVDGKGGTAYFLILDGFGADGAEQEARAVLGAAAVEEQASVAIAAEYGVTRLNPGILLATG